MNIFTAAVTTRRLRIYYFIMIFHLIGLHYSYRTYIPSRIYQFRFPKCPVISRIFVLVIIYSLFSIFSVLFSGPLGMQLEAQQAMLTGRTVFPYFVLKVSREQIVTDTLTQLLLIDESDLKKPLKVFFYSFIHLYYNIFDLI